jgi:hypothetical protein
MGSNEEPNGQIFDFVLFLYLQSNNNFKIPSDAIFVSMVKLSLRTGEDSIERLAPDNYCR